METLICITLTVSVCLFIGALIGLFHNKLTSDPILVSHHINRDEKFEIIDIDVNVKIFGITVYRKKIHNKDLVKGYISEVKEIMERSN